MREKRVVRVFLCQAKRAFARPLPFCLAQLCAAQHTDVYIVEEKRKRQKKEEK
jgi:hypothetical protein